MPRKLISLRLSDTGVAEVDRLAAASRVDRSTMIRRLLSEAIAARQRR